MKVKIHNDMYCRHFAPINRSKVADTINKHLLIFSEPKFISEEITQFWGEKQNAVLECEVSDPNVAVQWTFKGKEIQEKEGIADKSADLPNISS